MTEFLVEKLCTSEVISQNLTGKHLPLPVPLGLTQLTAEGSAGNLIQYRCRYSRQFEKRNVHLCNPSLLLARIIFWKNSQDL